jgi:hypothetical protein
MSKNELIIQELNNTPSGITIQDVFNMGLDEVGFSARRSFINNNEKKWKGFQIIRAKNKGKSVWKFAENNPRETLKYNRFRAKRAVNSLLNLWKDNVIAISNERSVTEKANLQTLMNKNQGEVLNATVNPQLVLTSRP